MNRFKVVPARVDDFEQVWLSRESQLESVPGFMEFSMLKGESNDAFALYISHSVWSDRNAFEDWTRSEAFRHAHKNVNNKKPLYLEPPQFEGFDVIQTVVADD